MPTPRKRPGRGGGPSARKPTANQFDEVFAQFDPAQTLQMIQSMANGRGVAAAERPRLRRPRRERVEILRVRVDLEHARPPIWRRLDLRSDLMLDQLHGILQAVYGWYDGHLHRFALGGSVFDHRSEVFASAGDIEEGDVEGEPEADIRLDETLAQVGDVLRYCYDFGDEWGLQIKLEQIAPAKGTEPPAVCLDGRRAAPPEDCGGVRDAQGLAELLDDPAYFDPAEVNAALDGQRGSDLDLLSRLRASDLAREVVELFEGMSWSPDGEKLLEATVRLVNDPPGPSTTTDERAAALLPIHTFLEHVGDDGVLLTGAGYLTPADVTLVADLLPRMTGWIGTRNRENQTLPVRWFREAMQAAKLVRRHQGRLVLTVPGRAALQSPERLWPHLVAQLPLGRDRSLDRPFGWLTLLGLATGDSLSLSAMSELLATLGCAFGDDRLIQYLPRVGLHLDAVLDVVRVAPAVARDLALDVVFRPA